eukprot:jgi/Botrbrau1/20638/Bobra.113_1s0062.1
MVFAQCVMGLVEAFPILLSSPRRFTWLGAVLWAKACESRVIVPDERARPSSTPCDLRDNAQCHGQRPVKAVQLRLMHVPDRLQALVIHIAGSRRDLNEGKTDKTCCHAHRPLGLTGP